MIKNNYLPVYKQKVKFVPHYYNKYTDNESFFDLSLFIPLDFSFKNSYCPPQVVLLTEICDNQGFGVTNHIEFAVDEAVRHLY